MIVTIHQPNFFPWLGFFRKLSRADVFVLLDAVPPPKTGSSWVNRVRLMVGGTAQFVTAPMKRPSGTPNINELELDDDGRWRVKFLKTLAMNYGRAPHYKRHLPLVEELVNAPIKNIAAFDEHAMVRLMAEIGFEKRIVRHSGMTQPEAFDLRGSERLAAICKALGADTYLSGSGADEYEDPAVYERAGLKLETSRYTPVPYTQANVKQFVPGLSILDALFNVGAENVRALFE